MSRKRSILRFCVAKTDSVRVATAPKNRPKRPKRSSLLFSPILLLSLSISVLLCFLYVWGMYVVVCIGGVGVYDSMYD